MKSKKLFMQSKSLLITTLSLAAVMAAAQSQAQNPNMDDITMTLREHNRGEIAQQLALPDRGDIRDSFREHGDLTQDQKTALREVKAMIEAGDKEGLMARREQLIAELLSEHGAQLRTYMDGHEDLRQLLKDNGVEAGDRAERAEQMTAYREQFQNMIDSDEVRGMLAEMREELEQHRQQAGNREDMMARRQELIANMSEHRERLQEELAGNDELRELLTEKRGEVMVDQRQALDELRESLGQREATADLAADLRAKLEAFKNNLQEQRNGN